MESVWYADIAKTIAEKKKALPAQMDRKAFYFGSNKPKLKRLYLACLVSLEKKVITQPILHFEKNEYYASLLGLTKRCGSTVGKRSKGRAHSEMTAGPKKSLKTAIVKAGGAPGPDAAGAAGPAGPGHRSYDPSDRNFAWNAARFTHRKHELVWHVTCPLSSLLKSNI